MKLKLALALSILFTCASVPALSQEASEAAQQPGIEIPLEISIGEERIQHEFFFSAPLSDEGVVSVFTQGRLAYDWDDPQANQTFLSTQVIWNLTPWLGLATGVGAVNLQITPVAAVSLLWGTEDGSAYINLFPTVVYNPNGPGGAESWNTELFALASWTPRFNETWGIFTQLLGGLGTPITFDAHLYSYVQLRAGLDYQGEYQAGLALDQNFFGAGEDLLYEDNIGIFVRGVLGR